MHRAHRALKDRMDVKIDISTTKGRRRLAAPWTRLARYTRAAALRAKRSPAGSRWASHALALLAAVASLGFEHGEAGILRSGFGAGLSARPTAAELALRGAAQRRSAQVGSYAERFDISRSLSRRIYDAAEAAGIDAELAYRLVRVESSFRPEAVGPAGSIGLSQVQPETARWLDPTVDREDLFETETNLQLGFRYLRMLIDRYGDTRLALLAYNRGPGTVQAVMAAGEDPDNGYAARVLDSVR
ncbi:MAG: lytic transglycosylase domain-containing protein [Gemmatimonadota bacterium]|nr:lytic transglycosylase domain-containing protein [Gemmatimonadota bacterium]